MDIVTYILCRKIAQAAVSGIQNIEIEGNTLHITLSDGTVLDMEFPTPKDGIDGKDGKDGKDGRDGIDGKDGKDGVDGKDGKDGLDGKDGQDGADGKDGEDGLSIVKVEIKNNHLICTLSDGSTIDAGEMPTSEASEGCFVQYDSKDDFPTQGADDTIYLAKDTETIYYWDGTEYKEVAGGSQGSAEFKTAQIEFDGINDTFELPVDDTTFSIYINGLYLTEGYDYTIDRTVSPNTVTFDTIYDEEDICTVVYIEGNGSGGSVNLNYATDEEIDELFEDSDMFAHDSDIDALFDFDDLYANEQEIGSLFKEGGL